MVSHPQWLLYIRDRATGAVHPCDGSIAWLPDPGELRAPTAQAAVDAVAARTSAYSAPGWELQAFPVLAHPPRSYLSTSGGAWRVIHDGLPLCADTTEPYAVATALRYRVNIAHCEVWDGDAGRWRGCPQPGDRVTHKGETGTVESIDREAFTSPMLTVRFPSRAGLAILRPSEVGA